MNPPYVLFFLFLILLRGRGAGECNVPTRNKTPLRTPPEPTTTDKPNTEPSMTTKDDFLDFFIYGYYGLGLPLIFDEVDPFHENELWDLIKANKTQIVLHKIDNSSAIMAEPKDKSRYLKVVAISDTHNQMAGVTIPDGDVLIHAGDLTNDEEYERLVEFNNQMGLLPHPHKLVIGGNHELGFDVFENKAKRRPRDQPLGTEEGWKLLTNVTYLLDQSVKIDGVKFYGSPYHALPGYPFYKNRKNGLREVWERIPSDVDVLITHSPPLGYLDLFRNDRWGCRYLLEKVEKYQPKFHIYGHVHQSYGAMTNGKTTFLNAAQCDPKNKIQDRPFVFWIEKKTATNSKTPKKTTTGKPKTLKKSTTKKP
ncbi:unnamed protein product [Caenorhabditis brenneri]